MSAKIKLNATSGGGSVSIQAPSSESNNRVFSLPSDADGTIVSKDSSNSLQNVTGVNGGQLGNRNLIINGAMQVAQRGIASTTSGYGTVDRFKVTYNGTDEAPEQRQANLGSGDTGPYEQGFRKALKITNGNQTGGAGATDHIRIRYVIEGQDINGSGWNYKSASSFITLSFWVKSSVAQNFYGFIRNTDGTMYQYPFETGSLTADTWTKITKTIPGNSNLTFDNDNGDAWELYIHQFAGTDETASGVTLNAWATYSGTAKMPDFTSTWYTTNDATFEITGVQLEVGSVATDFEHRSFGQELALCQRYFYMHAEPSESSNSNNQVAVGMGTYYGNPDYFCAVHFPVRMRTTPSLVTGTGSNNFVVYRNNGSDFENNVGVIDLAGTNSCMLYDSSASGTAGQSGLLCTYKAGATVAFNAEL